MAQDRRDGSIVPGSTHDNSVEGEAPETTGSESGPQADLVPGWLALAVLLLLVAVAAAGGFVVRGMLSDPGDGASAETSIAEWERAADRDPNDPETLLQLGYAYQLEERYEDALIAYESVIGLDPDNTGALYNRGMVLMQLERFKDAEAALWDVLEVAPDHALASKVLGEYYVAKSQYKSALVALEPVIATRPQFADLQYLAGYSCEQLGRTQEARAYYEAALTYAPDMVEARDGLVRLDARE
jgi:tetratricopeptide (TPR) repeat protein